MTTTDERQVAEYLREVDAALTGLPADRRQEIVDGLREHIEDAAAEDPAGLSAIIERLGTPEQIAAEAGVPAPEPAPGPGRGEIATLLLLTAGVFALPVAGPVAGLATMWAYATQWARRDRVRVTIGITGGLALAVVASGVAMATMDARRSTGVTLALAALIGTMVFLVPFEAAILLARRLWPDAFRRSGRAATPAPRPAPGPRRAHWSVLIYVVAGVLFVTSVAGLVVSAAGLVAAFPANGTQVTGPGTETLTLEPGRYLIAHEYPAVRTDFDEEAVVPRAPATLTVVAAATRTPVPVSLTDELRYMRDGTEGRSVAAFTIDEPGDYLFTSAYPEADPGPEATFVIGRSGKLDLIVQVLGIFAALGGIGLAILAALVTLVWTVARRQRGTPVTAMRP
jgi:hypothetical protein